MPDCDLIIVRVDPVNRPEAPRSVRDIYNRSVEISHNATFWLELGALAVVLRFVEEGRSPFGRARFHVMEASSVMERFPMSSKLNNYPPTRASPDLKIKNSPDKISCEYQLRERSVNKYLRWHDQISRPGQDPRKSPSASSRAARSRRLMFAKGQLDQVGRIVAAA